MLDAESERKEDGVGKLKFSLIFFFMWAANMELHVNSIPSPGGAISSVQFSCSVVSDSLRPHGLQHARPPYPSSFPRSCSNSCPLSRWCHPTISSSVIPFSFCLQSFPASGSSNESALCIRWPKFWSFSFGFIQDWFPLGWTGWISFKFKGLSRVFSNTAVQKHRFFYYYLCLVR